jgi:hypothetical protein
MTTGVSILKPAERRMKVIGNVEWSSLMIDAFKEAKEGYSAICTNSQCKRLWKIHYVIPNQQIYRNRILITHPLNDIEKFIKLFKLVVISKIKQDWKRNLE